MEYKKISDTELEVTKEEIKVDTSIFTATREYITNQIADITRQRDEMIALKEAELKECNGILTEMGKQGIK